jgi:hypothetical protein
MQGSCQLLRFDKARFSAAYGGLRANTRKSNASLLMGEFAYVILITERCQFYTQGPLRRRFKMKPMF